MLRYSTRIKKIAGVLSFVGIVTLPLKWVPFVIVGGVVLEIPNVVSTLFAVILPFAILVSKRMWRINLFFGLLLLWSVLYLCSMIFHDTPDGIPILRQQAMQGLFGWTLALSVAHSSIRVSWIGVWALIGLGATLLICAALAGVNLFAETVHYALTGDRLRFIYWTMRPIFNVFVANNADLNYFASQVNSLASAIVLFSALVFLHDRNEPRDLSVPAKVFALAFLLFAFLMFSTAANLVILVFLATWAFQAMSRAIFLRIALPILLAAIYAIVSEPLSEFIAANLLEDSRSRDARLAQYQHAFALISKSILFGVGYFEYGGQPVHNWPLFSWSTSGYFCFLVVLLIYFVFFLASARTLKLLRGSSVVLLPLIAIVVVRTFVGGAGGIPSDSAIVAMSVVLGLLERYWRAERQPLAGPVIPALREADSREGFPAAS